MALSTHVYKVTIERNNPRKGEKLFSLTVTRLDENTEYHGDSLPALLNKAAKKIAKEETE